MHTPVGGIVLCGGQSRRMGKPKAWLPVGSEYLLQRVVGIVVGVVEPVIVAARPHQQLPPLPASVETVCDAVDNAGPLAGLAAAFANLAGRCDAVFVTSCDHPLIRPPFIRRLIALLGDDPGIIPSYEDHTYPLVAVYRLTVSTLLADMLARNQFRVHDFAHRCGARILSPSDLKDVDPDFASLRNVNDPRAYAQLLQGLRD